MGVTVVLGAQWGDEGKGKIVDMLAESVDYVVRYNGGNNAGHTIVNEYGTLALHLIPSGIFYPHVTCVVGNGVVVHPHSLLAELAELKNRGINSDGRLIISDKAHVVMPWHILRDAAQEKQRGDRKLGTTLRGIGPAMADKTSRNGIRIEDLCSSERFGQRFAAAYDENVRLLRALGWRGKIPPAQTIMDEYIDYGRMLARYVANTERLLAREAAAGKDILLEGAQGALLDVDFGTYPYVTSSATGSAAACQGSGIAPNKITRVIGVVKAYTTRVGEGPFLTEMDTDTAEAIRNIGKEYGATTGRPRRCGWLDLASLTDVVERNGITELAITKLDVLSFFDPLQIGVLSGTGPGGEKIYYVETRGWNQTLNGITSFSDLPHEAQAYINMIESATRLKISYVSVGQARGETIQL